jgi:muramoyltetrapeptide carboxypeptidase
MNPTIPSFLKKGDTIGIAATARWITPEQLKFAVDLFESWGFDVKIAPNIHSTHFQLAGSKTERLIPLQDFLDDAEIKAIVIARGGYGTVHLIDDLLFDGFYKNPKWICGYSDITVLHAHLNGRGIPTIHSTMPISFGVATDQALENFRQSLTGELETVSWDNSGQPLFNTMEALPVFGGNLSVIYSLLGSESLQFDVPHFLFLEDVDEMFYHIDRMMMGLKRAGVFRQTKGFILGGLTLMRDNVMDNGFPTNNPWGSNALQTILSVASELKIPVIHGFPAGHQNDNRAFYLGVKANIISHGNASQLRFQHS